METIISKYHLSPEFVPGLQFIPPGKAFDLEMIAGSKILTVQREELFNPLNKQMLIVASIWAMNDADEKERRKRTFVLINDGLKFARQINWRYIGTFQLHVSTVPMHLFEIVSDKPIIVTPVKE